MQHVGGGAVGEGRRPEDTSGFEKPMKFSGGSDRLVEVVEPRGRSRIGILEDGEELTSAWPPGQTLSDATQTTEDEEATLRELLMRYTFESLRPIPQIKAIEGHIYICIVSYLKQIFILFGK